MTTLNNRVKNFSTRLGNVGADGLLLMQDCANHIANNRDWDASANLMSKTDDKFRAVFKLILRAKFGDKLTLARDKKHPSGYRFTLGWEANEVAPNGNAFGIVAAATSKRVKYTSPTFVKELREALDGPAEKAEKSVKERALAYAKRLDAEGVSLHAFIIALQAIEKSDKATTPVILDNKRAAA